MKPRYKHLIPGANASFVEIAWMWYQPSPGENNATIRSHGKLPRPRFPRKLLIYLVAASGLEPLTYGL